MLIPLFPSLRGETDEDETHTEHQNSPINQGPLHCLSLQILLAAGGSFVRGRAGDFGAQAEYFRALYESSRRDVEEAEQKLEQKTQ